MSPHRRAARTVGIVAAAALLTVVTAACSSGGTVTVTTTVTPSAQPGQNTSGGAAADGSITDPANSGATDASGASGDGSPTGTSGVTTSSPISTPPTTTSAAPKKVHVSTFEADGSTYGVGMAVMVLFSISPTDAAAFEKAATVTVNGKPATGAWFWQKPTLPGYQMEALYRESKYWPAHSAIAVDLPVQGLSAGEGLVYDDSLTLNFAIGASHISQVNNAQHRMVVTSDGTVVKNFPVSLGSASTPTYDGVKVVMEKSNPVEMKSDPGDPHPYDIMVPWSVRITNSGEFVHAASWNGGNIGSRNTSHGCTNLNTADAEWYYNFSIPGDIVEYPDANPAGTVQPSWDGWGWWNLSWSQWTNGGLLAPNA